MIQITTAVLLLLAASVYATPLTPCPGIALPTSVFIDGCTEEPCQFKRGSTVVVDVEFTALKTRLLTVQLKATTNGITTNFPLPETDACLSLTGASCPLAGGETPSYKLSVPIPANYPKVSTLLELHLRGDNGIQVTCTRLRAAIVD